MIVYIFCSHFCSFVCVISFCTALKKIKGPLDKTLITIWHLIGQTFLNSSVVLALDCHRHFAATNDYTVVGITRIMWHLGLTFNSKWRGWSLDLVSMTCWSFEHVASLLLDQFSQDLLSVFLVAHAITIYMADWAWRLHYQSQQKSFVSYLKVFFPAFCRFVRQSVTQNCAKQSQLLHFQLSTEKIMVCHLSENSGVEAFKTTVWFRLVSKWSCWASVIMRNLLSEGTGKANGLLWWL